MRRRSKREPWSDEPDQRVRVLLECEPESSPSIIAPVIERHGYAVRTCEGPGHDGCDLLENGACALVDGADVVVNMLHEPVVGPQIRDSVAATRRPPAVVAEMTPLEAQASGARTGTQMLDRDRITVLESPVNTEKLITAIGKAVADKDRPVPIWGDGFC